MWDETKERLKFRVKRKGIFVSIEIFVFKCTITWGWEDGPPHVLDCVIPALPVPSTGFMHLLSAMRNHPWTRPIFKFALLVLSAAKKFNLKFGCLDAASSNDKCVAVEFTESLLAFLIRVEEYIHCMSHQNMLGHLDTLVSVHGSFFLRQLMAMASFYNLSLHRLRMLLVVEDAIRELAEVSLTQDPADKLYAEVASEYYVRWAGVSASSGKKKKEGAPESDVTSLRADQIKDLYLFNFMANACFANSYIFFL